MSKKVKQALMTIHNPSPLEALKKCEFSIMENGWMKYRRKDIGIIRSALNKAKRNKTKLDELQEFARVVVPLFKDQIICILKSREGGKKLIAKVVEEYGK